VVTNLVAQGCVGDDEQEDADRRGKARRVPHRPVGMIPSLKSNLKFHPLMANMILLHILIGN
jgi:hypothetical protein